jgi:hypothetical protein
MSGAAVTGNRRIGGVKEVEGPKGNFSVARELWRALEVPS